MLHGNTANARKQRRTMTLPELLIWRELKRQPVKFRRQHAAGPYVLDFYSHQARLAVEIDGAAHDTEDRAQRDMERDSYFESRGIATMRMPAKQVLSDLNAAVESILETARDRINNSSP
jgi:very-short-patch-repair endonuclease